MIHVYAASNAQPQREKQGGKKYVATQKSFDGAGEASGVLISNEKIDGASEASGVLLAIKSQLLRSERSFFICNKDTLYFHHRDLKGRAVLTMENAIRA